MEPKIMKAYCPVSKKYYIFNIADGKAVDFIPIDKSRYDELVTTDTVTETAKNLLPNEYESSRRIASSSRVASRCSKKVAASAYDFQCAYCSKLCIDTGSSSKDLKDCSIAVTSAHYDDIGKVVKAMGLKCHPFNNTFQDDIIFVNCGTSDKVSADGVREFVNRGGILYVSDWAINVLDAAFPDMIPRHSKYPKGGTVVAQVEDQEIREMIGYTVKVFFDLTQWVKVDSYNAEVLLSTTQFGGYTPLMLMKKYGKGAVFFTSFHNHEMVNQEELTLLKLLICKQLGVKTGKKVNDISKLMGLNITVK